MITGGFYSDHLPSEQTWGIAIGGAILQNQLSKKLPQSLIETLPSGAAYTYSLIPVIGTLSSAEQGVVRQAFADSLKIIWETMAGISGLGLLSCLLMKEVEMRVSVDDQWALEQKARAKTTPVSQAST